MQKLARRLPLPGEEQEVSLRFLITSSASVVLMATLYSRGIPAGYVSSLEKRLAETERALFFALAEIYDGAGTQHDYESMLASQGMRLSVPSNTTATTQQEKTQFLESWADSPLANREQARSWFESKRQEALPGSKQLGSPRIRDGAGQVHTCQNTSSSPRQTHQREPLGSLEAGFATGSTTGVVQAGRASSFAEANKRLYF